MQHEQDRMELQQAMKDKEVGYHKTSIVLKNKFSKNTLTFVVEQIYKTVTKKFFCCIQYSNWYSNIQYSNWNCMVPKCTNGYLVVTLPIIRMLISSFYGQIIMWYKEDIVEVFQLADPDLQLWVGVYGQTTRWPRNLAATTETEHLLVCY